MIHTDSRPDVFDDAVHATAFMATAMLKRGELLLPSRIRDHLADGRVVVHLMRGEDDVAVYEATLTSRSTVTGIEWPAEVKPRTSLTVMCPRGGASHDIGVLLPDLKPTVTFLGPVPDEGETVAEPEPTFAQVAASLQVWNVGDPEPEIGTTVRSVHERSFTRYESGWQPGPWKWPALLASEAPLVEVPRPGELGTAAERTPVTDDQLATITGALTAYAEATAPVPESTLPGPAEYTVPADLPVRGELELPADPWAEAASWPGHEDLAAGETTEVFTAVLVPAAPDPTEGDVEPGTVFSAALVAVRSQALVARQEPPRRRGWLERRLRLAARLVLDESRTATRLVLATASLLILAGTGVGFLLWEVAR